jgi:5-methylcytosine-specific restriction endonuclease McrA
MSDANAAQRLRDRANPEYSQAKGHNQRVKERYPEAWAKSTITNDILADWVKTARMLACPYCANPVKEIDHKQPLSKGGEHALENLEMLCMDCNRSKGDMTAEEFKEFRNAHPVKPRYLNLRDYGIDYSVLKDTGKRPRTRSLFKEMWATTKNQDYPPIFTLRGDDDVDGLISLKRIYLDLGDPTEYRVAKAVFNDLRHWRKLCQQSWFTDYLNEWRKELRAKLRSEATEKLLEAGTGGNVQALKAVVTEDFLFHSYLDSEEPRRKQRVGRPSKEPEDTSIDSATLDADLARIGLGPSK